MKIPDEILAMSKARRREWVKAIDEVYEGYKKSADQQPCSFCIVVSLGCDSCLWKIFKACSCGYFARCKGYTGWVCPEPHEVFYPKWKRIRYPMLRKWRRTLVEAGI